MEDNSQWMAQINRLQQLIEKLEYKVCAQGGAGAAPLLGTARSVLGPPTPSQQPPSSALALSQSCTHALAPAL